MVEINLGRTKELRVHDALEYDFEDLLQEFVSEEEAANLTLKRAQEILGYGTMHGVFYDDKMIGFCGLYQENHERTRGTG